MTRNNTITYIDNSTEEKIKKAARIVFTGKGYAAAKVRDIAAEADINVALVNYYFRSKEKLFEIIMDETIRKHVEKIQNVINDESSTLEDKVEAIVEHYTGLLIENPELPYFFVNEIMSGSNKLPKMVSENKLFMNSYFLKQLQDRQKEGKMAFHPVNILVNMLGLIVFPFLARPLLVQSGTIQEDEFKKIIEERKKLVPIWLTQIMNQ